jgi:hypothetical protein
MDATEHDRDSARSQAICNLVPAKRRARDATDAYEVGVEIEVELPHAFVLNRQVDVKSSGNSAASGVKVSGAYRSDRLKMPVVLR